MYLFCEAATAEPKMLVVCEKRKKREKDGLPRQWGPPGGGADETKDYNEWQSAAREFGEEVTVDWSEITKATNCFTWLRVDREKDDGARWALLVNQSKEEVSASLRLHYSSTGMTKETCGVDWIRCKAVLPIEKFNPIDQPVELLDREEQVQLRSDYAEDTQYVISVVVRALEERPLFCY